MKTLRFYAHLITRIYSQRIYQLITLVTIALIGSMITYLNYTSENLQKQLHDESISKLQFIVKSIKQDAQIGILQSDEQSLIDLTNITIAADSNIINVSYFDNLLNKKAGKTDIENIPTKQWTTLEKNNIVTLIYKNKQGIHNLFIIKIQYDIKNNKDFVNGLKIKTIVFLTCLILLLNIILFRMFYTLEKVTFEKAEMAGETTIAKTKEYNQRLFLASMSHEIRTPLNGIMGLLELLEKTKLSDSQKKYTNTISVCSQTLLVVINDILDLSKIEEGEIRLNYNPINIKTAIQELYELFSARVSSQNIELKLNYGKETPNFIITDLARFNQILYNIVGNAIKFTSVGSVTININFKMKDNNEGELIISVIDTGVGMPHDKLETIFKPFKQLEDYESRTFQGTGLGLSITKKLIEIHNGTIEATSKLSEGSQFTIKLPCKYLSNNLAMEASPSKIKKDISNLNILLAEDNPINQMVAMELLEQEKAIVQLVENGQEALDMLNTRQFDVILMDMQMPIMSGYEAMEKLRRKNKGKDYKIIAVTAHVNDKELKRCLDAGADSYISKPFEIEHLKTEILKLVNRIS